MRNIGIVAVLAVVAVSAACGGSPPAAPQAPVVEATIFTPAGAFASAPASANASAAHSAKKLAAPGKTTACLSCHKAGGTGPSFLFAGTIYGDKDATKGAADVEIRVVDGKGAATSVHTDGDGNFWVKGDALAGPAHAGARNEVKTKVMHQPLTTGDCNSCHDTNIPMLLTP